MPVHITSLAAKLLPIRPSKDGRRENPSFMPTEPYAHLTATILAQLETADPENWSPLGTGPTRCQ